MRTTCFGTSLLALLGTLACGSEIPIGQGQGQAGAGASGGTGGTSSVGGSSGVAGAAGATGGAGGGAGSSGSGGSGGVAPTSACMGLAGHQVDAAWPTVGGCSSRQGRSRYSPAATLEPKWTLDAAKLGYGWAAGYVAPAVAADGTLYVGTVGVGNPAVVAALTPAGASKWKLEVDKDVHFGWNTPTLAADGVAYVGSTNFGQIAAPWESALYAVRPDGSTKWTYADDGASVSHVALAPDGTLYYGAYGQLVAVAADGKLAWSVPTGGGTTTPSLGADGTIYVGASDENLYAVAPNGSVKWKFVAGLDVDGVPVVGDDGTIYVTASYKKLFAIHPDGSLAWEYSVTPEPPLNVGGGLAGQPALGSDGTLYVGHNQSLHAIGKDGKQLWSEPSIKALSAPVVAANGNILVTTTDHRLCELSPGGVVIRCIQVIPQSTEVAYLSASPVILADGSVVVVVWGSATYAFGP